MSSWPGTSWSSDQHAGMSSCCVHQQIHSAVLWGEGSGVKVCCRSSSIPLPAQGISPPPKNSWMWGSRGGRHSRSSSSDLASGLDQSDDSPVPSLSLQVRKGHSSALASFSGLSSKVTCYLDLMGLGDWAHLLVGSPWGDSTWGALVWQFTFWDLKWWLPKHLWLPVHWWLQLRECLNLSILSSSSATATNVCWWASLTTDRASSQEPCFISWISHSWHNSGHYSWPGGHVLGCWQGANSIPPPAV